MPIKITPSHRESYTQSTFTNFMEKNDSGIFKEKILKISKSKQHYAGFCYGLSVKFLHYCDKDQEREFLDTYNKYFDDVNHNNLIMTRKREDIGLSSIRLYNTYVDKKIRWKKEINYLLKYLIYKNYIQNR